MGRGKMSQSNAVQAGDRPLEGRLVKSNPNFVFDSHLDLA
jgi:hypothetical protein